MAIAYDAESSSSGTGDLSWTHTPIGSPRGVIVLVAQNNNPDQITAVTYGGTPMTRLISAVKTSGEDGRSYIYFLGGGITAGAQTVAVTTSGLNNRVAAAISMTANADTEEETNNTFTSDSASSPIDVVLSIGAGVETYCMGTAFCGRGNLGGFAPGTNYTNSSELDFGTSCGSNIRRTSNATGGDETVQWTATASDDWVCAVVAIKESVATIQIPRPLFLNQAIQRAANF